MVFFYKILFLMFVGFCLRIATRVSSKSFVDVFITAFTIFSGSIILTGFVLSFIHKTGDVRFWAGGVFLPAFVFYIRFTRYFVKEKVGFSGFSLIGSRIQLVWFWLKDMTVYLRILFFLMLLTFVGLWITNFLMVRYTVPNEWDSMTGHLVRVLYFIQRGTMEAPFFGTNWNIDTYPRSICNIQIYSYLITGKIENSFKLIHFVSYSIGVFAVFGITDRITKNYSASLFCALCFGLLPNVLLQAITTDTDIVLMAYLACLVYFLLAYHDTLKRRYLYLAGIMFGMALGHKITFVLLFPGVGLLILYAFTINVINLKLSLLRLYHFVIACGIGVALFTLPTGYISNIRTYGHPIGPPTATKHQSVERAGGIKNLFVQGSRNVLRYGFDFLNLDGLRNLPYLESEVNAPMKKPFVVVAQKLNLRLEEKTDFTIIPFAFQKKFIFYNSLPFWGILGFALIWPLVFVAFFRRNTPKIYTILGIGTILHLLALSFSAPYDPFKGRYFISTAILAVPFLGLLFTENKGMLAKGFTWLKGFVGVVVLTACVSSVLSVYLHRRSLPIKYEGQRSAFRTERIKQLTFARPDITLAYQRFDSLVPQNAVVALATINDDYEYPLFGKKLSRKLIPINPFERGLQPIPENAQYLFFAKSVIKPLLSDIRLGTDTTLRNKVIVPGEDYYLRKLR